MSNKFLSAVTFEDGLAQSVTFSFISTDDLPAIPFSGLSDVDVGGVVNASILYYASSDGKWHSLPPYEFGAAVLSITGLGQLPSWQSNTLPSDLAYTDVANVFVTVPQSVTVAGKTLQIKDTKTITTDNTELVLEETGDTVGTVRLRLQNRTNSNGAIFENTAVNLVDFGFIPSAGTGSQQNIRLENRAGSETVIASPEFQIGGTGGPGLVVSGANAAVFAHNSSTNPTLGAYNYTSVATHRQQWKAVGSWPTSTDASRKARVVFSVYDTAARECFRMEASGSAAMISFFGGAAVVQQTGDVAAALVAYGLLTGPTYGTHGRATAQTAAAASVATATVGAADGSFMVSANVLITASVTHSFSATCTYTDEGGTSRVLTLNFSQLTGAFVTALTNLLGASAYEGVPVHIRAKAGTTITIDTTGTFTSVTYNVEGHITQVA